jgi:hypothetical protein
MKFCNIKYFSGLLAVEGVTHFAFGRTDRAPFCMEGYAVGHVRACHESTLRSAFPVMKKPSVEITPARISAD